MRAAGLLVIGRCATVLCRTSGVDVTDRGTSQKVSDVNPVDWHLLWEDNFTGPVGAPPNPAWWTVRDNMTHGPLEQQLYTSSSVGLDGEGHLVLTTSRATIRGPGREYNFTSGWVDTQGKVNATFGRWEIRAILPNPRALGIWPAHWLMPEANSWNCWPVGGEIDIMESNGGIFK